ncbi:MAG: polysaccharide biosynthesis tyrosine autokinase [Lachnospiraceae bacterium]|nr:polysaccharide biosynthesis tyrosine autokinase [Lachnospiraceae bacterium]
MEQKYGQNSKDYLTVDFSYIFRLFRKNALVTFMCAVIAAGATYIVMDQRAADSYTVSVQLTVVPRDTTTSRYNTSSVNTAVTRCVNVLNSDSLKARISESLSVAGTIHGSGSLSASRVGTTNLITLTAKSTSAEYAFWLLKTALDLYPEFSDYYGSTHMMQRLTSLSADNIAHTQSSPLRYTVLVALLVLAAGMGLTLVFALVTDKVHSKDQAEALLEIPLLGELHFVKKKKGQKAILLTDGMTDALYLEEMDKLTTHVREKMDAHRLKTLLVTSIRENDGKSSVAANIALNLAQRGRKVLLIDGDMRQPALIRIFELPTREKSSLSDCLRGSTEMIKAARKIDGVDRLTVILQEKDVADADKLLEGEELSEILEELKATADYIILDTPPVGAVRDAEIMSRTVDAALLIFRQDSIHAADLNDTVDVLENAGTRVIGGAMNMARGAQASGSRKSGYGYGGYYGYYGRKGNDA